MMMSETLLERLKRHQEFMPDVAMEVYPGDVLELIEQANNERDASRVSAKAWKRSAWCNRNDKRALRESSRASMDTLGMAVKRRDDSIEALNIGIAFAEAERNEARARAAELEAIPGELRAALKCPEGYGIIEWAKMCARDLSSIDDISRRHDEWMGRGKRAEARVEQLASALRPMIDMVHYAAEGKHQVSDTCISMENARAALAAALAPVAETETSRTAGTVSFQITQAMSYPEGGPVHIFDSFPQPAPSAPAPDGLRERCERAADECELMASNEFRHPTARQAYDWIGRRLRAALAGEDGGR
jgi:hypothetical protein